MDKNRNQYESIKQKLLKLQALANAVQHGWWESQPSDEHCLTLVVCKLAEAYGIDLWKHVHIKLQYNIDRPYKHGKKY